VIGAPTWSPEALTDIVWALKRLLEQAPSKALAATEAEYWVRVDRWIQEVEPVLRQDHESRSGSFNIPAFPLTSPQLRALEGSLQQVVQTQSSGGQERSVAGSPVQAGAPLWATIEHLHASLRAVHRSSYLIFGVLIAMLVLNVLCLTLMSSVSRYLVILANITAVLITTLFWAIHNSNLRHHWTVFYRHAAIHR
jgi:hypothetical protein